MTNRTKFQWGVGIIAYGIVIGARTHDATKNVFWAILFTCFLLAVGAYLMTRAAGPVIDAFSERPEPQDPVPDMVRASYKTGYMTALKEVQVSGLRPFRNDSIEEAAERSAEQTFGKKSRGT